MSSRFFIPHKPPFYEKGINGKKVLVVGASYDCRIYNCVNFSKCTNPRLKDSSQFDNTCDEAIKRGRPLHDEPYCTTGETKAYNVFAKLIQPFIPGQYVWDYLAYTNYVQFFIPTVKVQSAYLSDRDFESFIESVVELDPDIVIFWGCVIDSPIKYENPYVVDNGLLDTTGNYITKMRIPEMSHDVILFNCYHPSSRDWHPNFEKCSNYIKMIIESKVI